MPDVNQSTRYAAAARPDRTAWVVLGCLGAFVVAAIGLIVIVVVVVARTRRTAATDEPPRSRGPSSQPWAPCTGTPAAERSFEEPLLVADPARVDVAEVFAQAQSLARRLEPSAGLTMIESISLAVDGRYDLSSGSLSVHFEYRCLDSAAPPGADRHQGQVFVFLRGGKARAERIPDAGVLLDLFPPLHAPSCGTAAAWRAAVASGVPADARATFSYSPPSADLDESAVWIVGVPGHPEHQRHVDGRTCTRVMQGNRLFPIVLPPAGAPSTEPAPPPAITPAPSASAQTAPRDGRAPMSVRRPMEGDLRHTDVLALLPAARALAEELRPGAQLVGIFATRVGRGTIDLRPNNIMTGVEIVYQLEYLGKDPAIPLQGAITVRAKLGFWEAEWQPGIAWKLGEDDFRAGPLETPKCDLVRVWDAAKLDPERTYTVRYHNERAHHPKTPNVWKIDVGTGLLAVDGATCAFLGAWK